MCPVGAAYGQAEKEIKDLVESCGLPFLPTPMGKGVLPDDHANCVAAARSRSVPLHRITDLLPDLFHSSTVFMYLL